MNQENKLNKIFEELKIENLSDEEKADFLARAGELLQKRILLRIIDSMNEKEQEEFEKFLEKETNQEKINQYLEEKVPNLEEIIKEETEAMRKDILGFFEK